MAACPFAPLRAIPARHVAVVSIAIDGAAMQTRHQVRDVEKIVLARAPRLVLDHRVLMVGNKTVAFS